MIPDRYLLDSDQLEITFETLVLPRLLEQTAPTKGQTPSTVYLGGQPGAGKTRARSAIIEQYDGNLYPIDPDRLRMFHPDYDELCDEDPVHMAEYTNPFAGAMVDRAVSYCEAHGIDYIIEGTWRSPEDMAKWMRRGHGRGRSVHAIAMAVPPALSSASTVKRYLDAIADGESARWTNVGYFDPINRAMPDYVRAIACNALVDRFTVADRNGLIPGSDFRGPKTRLGMPVWTSRFDRPLDETEIRLCEDTMNAVETMLDHASPEYAEARIIRGSVMRTVRESRETNAGGSCPRTFVPVSPHAGLVWVNPYVRGDGTTVSGYWQDRS